MAVTKTLLKVTNTEAVFKVAGTAATGTLDLQTDLFPYLSIAPQAGTITCTTAGTGVTGVNTNFTADWVGSKLYNAAGTYIGIVTVYNSATSLTLGANAAVNVSGAAFQAEHQAQKLDVGNQVVNITGITWTGAAAGIATVSRGGTVIATLTGGSLGYLDFSGQDMPPDTVGNTADIDVIVSGGQMEVWVKTRKVSGWKGTYDISAFGPYDNPVAPGV